MTLPETSGRRGVEMSGVGEAKKSGLAGPAVTLIGPWLQQRFWKPRPRQNQPRLLPGTLASAAVADELPNDGRPGHHRARSAAQDS